ncbi:hypothetical protein [Deferribacter desulfuricans]|uniref:hypothetical protein n=1 Tax=Deferribacter desulfuricans TaxID=197162 RepID=UPI0002FFA963|nr:hypothetical protein [Deferribacter desulfuricans]
MSFIDFLKKSVRYLVLVLAFIFPVPRLVRLAIVFYLFLAKVFSSFIDYIYKR